MKTLLSILGAIVLVIFVFGIAAGCGAFHGKTKTVYVNASGTPVASTSSVSGSSGSLGIAPAQSAAGTASQAGCHVINDYGLDGKLEVASSGSFIHVEYWWDGQPERETLIPTSAADGGRFILTRPLKGHVWEYPAGCTQDEVMAQVNANIQRRLAGHANNAGYVEWTTTGLFLPSGRTGSATTTTTSSAPAAPAPQAQAQLPDRTTCGEIAGTPYRSENERAFYLANCVTQSAPAPAPQAQAPAAPAPQQQASAPAQQCNATQETLQIGNHTVVGPAVVTLWTNRGPQRNPDNLNLPSWGQAEVKAIINNGETWNILDSGGTVFHYPAGCDPKSDFDKVNLPAKSWNDLHAADMVK